MAEMYSKSLGLFFEHSRLLFVQALSSLSTSSLVRTSSTHRPACSSECVGAVELKTLGRQFSFDILQHWYLYVQVYRVTSLAIDRMAACVIHKSMSSTNDIVAFARSKILSTYPYTASPAIAPKQP